MPETPTTVDGYTWIEKEVTRKGKTYKQWFRVKNKDAGAKAKKLRAFAPAPPPPKVLTVQEKHLELKNLKHTLPKEEAATHLATYRGLDKHTGYTNPKPAAFSPEEKPFDRMQRKADAVYEKLSKPEQEAVHSFTGGGYRLLRAAQAGLTPEQYAATVHTGPKDFGYENVTKAFKLAQAKLPDLQSAQEKLSFPDPTAHGPLSRGMNVTIPQLHDMLHGEEITHDGYSTSSASYSRKTANGFLEEANSPAVFSDPKSWENVRMPVVIRYNKVLKGANLMFSQNGNNGEQEVALPKGRFKITKKSWATDQFGDGIPGHFVIDVEQVE